jgi:hypothetical protein
LGGVMRRIRFAVALAGACLLATAFGGSAFASSEVYHGTHTRGAGAASSTGNLYSHGGSVETTPAVYIVWWGPQWATGFSTGGYTSAQAQTYTTDFFNGVGGSSWINSTTQYCQGVASGTYTCPSGAQLVGNPTGQLKGTWTDTSSLPRRISQSAIANEAAKLAQHFGGVNPNATYFVYTPSGHSMNGFGTQWCAWHSSSGNMPYAYMPYQPDAGASCGENFVNATSNSYGNGYFDGFSVVGGHEYAEAETDPFPNTGWLDGGGSENGDKCAWNAASTNITLGAHQYAVQPLWSNASSGCVTSY